MSITVELTYDMSKALGVQRFELEEARTVADVVRLKFCRLCIFAFDGVVDLFSVNLDLSRRRDP